MGSVMKFIEDQMCPENEAQELTHFIWRDLTSVWTLAFRDYNQIPEEQRGRLGSVPFGPMVAVYCFTQSHASEIFSGREAEGIVRCDDAVGAVAFYVHEKLLLRFNTVDKHGVVRHSQSGTDHRISYFRQYRLPGINNDATRLTVGCITNATKTDVGSVVLSCQFGDAPVYKFRIDEQEGGAIALPAPSSPPLIGGPTFANAELKKKKPR
jgi:hypothetical protein